MVTGEAGIGKSRLLEELQSQAHQAGFEVFRGNCSQVDASMPLGPWLDALRAFLAPLSAGDIRQRMGALAPEFTKLLPELGLLLPDIPPTPPLEPAAEKYRSFESISRFVAPANPAHPCLMILEDLHWSDSLSLELIHFLARRASGLAIMLVGSYRSEEQPPSLVRFVSELNRARLAQEIALKPLDRDEVERMAHAEWGPEVRISPDLLDGLLRLTDGSPYFLEEILKSISDEGRRAAVSLHTSLTELQVPPSIQRLVRQRAEQLPEVSRGVLIEASVIGERVEFGILQATTHRDEAALTTALKNLIEAHLLVQESADQFAFRHELTRQAIYSMLMLRERKEMHRKIGEILERLGRDTASAQLAYHFHQAEDWPKAFEYSRRAGEQALALYASREAYAHFAQALDAAQHLDPPPGPEVEVQLYRARAQAREMWGDFDGARLDYEAALDLARRGAGREHEWQTLIDLGLLWQSRDLERAGEYFRAALELAYHLDDPSFLAQSLNRIGNWHMNQGQATAALSFHRDALELFRQRGDRQGMAQSLDLLGMASYALGDIIQGVGCLEQAIPIFRELDDRQGLVNALLNLTFRALSDTEVLGKIDYLQLKSLCDEAFQIAHESNWSQGEASALIQAEICVEKAGEYRQALGLLDRAHAMLEDRHYLELFARLHLRFGNILSDLLSPVEAQEHAETGSRAVKELGSGLLMLAATSDLALAALLRKDLARARALLDALLPGEYPEGEELLPRRKCWAVRAELQLMEGQPRRALELIDRLLASAANLGQSGPHSIPYLSLLRGRALAALGRVQDADVELQGALPVARTQGRLPLEWRLHAELGKVLRAAGRREDADQEFSAARTIIEQLAEHVPDETLRDNFLQHALEMLPPAHVPTPRQAAKKEFGGLTAREREIATLIAQAKSNREISAQLIISEKTTERHIANILKKLDFGSRTQIAVWAVEKGLHK